MKLIKRLLFLAVALVVVLALALGGVVLYADSLVKTGVEKGGTYALGVPTTLASADVGLFSGELGLEDLRIDNPPGFDQPRFFEMTSANAAVSLGSLSKDVVEVPTIELTGIRVDLERKASGSNYQVILDNLKRFEGKGEAGKKESGGKKFIVRRVVIRDVKVRADMIGVGGGATAVTVPIHEVSLNNVGSAEGGATAGEIAAVIVKAVLASAAAEGGGIIPADILGDLKGGLSQLSGLREFGVESIGAVGEQATKVADEIGETVRKAGEEVIKGVEDAAKGLGEGLKGLLPGKK